jgi:hypothetical protein
MTNNTDTGILTEVRSRPAYHLACIWLEDNAMTAQGPRTAHENIDVSWLANIVRLLTGADILEETWLVALNDRGFRSRLAPRGLRTNLDERVLLDVIPQTYPGVPRLQTLVGYGDAPSDATARGQALQ